mmetsp:Transcript_143403/g.357289  ORF Transcript_143403/g.357289 Transcript_143403/m.357289 type:complete len:209 (+) Transcript_143403:70-696(+)
MPCRHRWALLANRGVLWGSVQVWSRGGSDLLDSCPLRRPGAHSKAQLGHQRWYHRSDPEAFWEVLGLVCVHVACSHVHPAADGRVRLHLPVRDRGLGRAKVVAAPPLLCDVVLDDRARTLVLSRAGDSRHVCGLLPVVADLRHARDAARLQRVPERFVGNAIQRHELQRAHVGQHRRCDHAMDALLPAVGIGSEEGPGVEDCLLPGRD